MLLKLFKYDMKSVSWNLGLLHLSLFVLILVARGFENIMPILSDILSYWSFLNSWSISVLSNDSKHELLRKKVMSIIHCQLLWIV